MSIPKKTKILFPDKLSPEQMQKYLFGEMTDAEQHQTEQYLLENQPETEALEGLGKIKNPEVLKNDLNELQKRIRARAKEAEKTPVMPLGRWKYNPMNIAVAACVAVMLSSVTFLIVLNNYRQNDKPIAVNPVQEEISKDKAIEPAVSENDYEKSEKIADKKESITPTDKSKSAITQLPLVAENKVLKTRETEAIKQPLEEVATEKPIPDNQPAEKETAKKEENISEKKPVTTSIEENKNNSGYFAEKAKADDALDTKNTQNYKKKDLPIPSVKTSDTKAKKMINVTDKNVALQVLKGKVTDEAGNPLPGVNVSIKGSREGVVTDMDGEYQIEVTDNTRLTYSFIGYTTTEVQVRNPEQTLAVALQPDVQALNEVVVIAYGSDDKKDEMERFFTTEPTLGYARYKQYVKTNLQYPQAALENRVEGNVIISFVVNENRQLSDFKVRKGIGYGCDEEAVRLVKNGPGWNPALKEGKPVSQKIRMKIRFKLNK